MSDQPSTAEIADRASRRRTGVVIALSGMFLTQQALFLTSPGSARLVDQVRAGAWLFLAGVLLAVVLTGGFWLKPKAVRALMEDEATQANRAASIRLGYGLTMAAAMLLYVLSGFTEISAREALHGIVSVGLVSALLRFAMLEKRALG